MTRTREEIFEIWVPPHGAYSTWAVPVLFAQLPERPDDGWIRELEVPLQFDWCPSLPDRTCIVLDLSGPASVSTALALAESGYRPVPMFNACHGEHAVIDQTPIMQALHAGADVLVHHPLADDAPPVFMIDSRRMNGSLPVLPGMFDNRWKVFPQDFPAADVLLSRDIKSCLVVQDVEAIAEDLTHVLRRWQDAGLEVLRKIATKDEPPTIVDVPKPPKYRSVWYRAAAQEEMKRNVRGGFGYIVPEPRRG